MIRRPSLRWPPWGRSRDDKKNLANDKRTLSQVRAQWPDVQAVAALLYEHQRRNHFAESINTIFRGGK
jgi:hypothetical protein